MCVWVSMLGRVVGSLEFELQVSHLIVDSCSKLLRILSSPLFKNALFACTLLISYYSCVGSQWTA